MMIKTTNPTALVDEMRSLGESMSDKGMIEYDLSTGELIWCNEYALNKIEYKSKGAWDLSIFDVIPNEFHSQLKKYVANITRGKDMGLSVWPTKTTSGDIAWWYVYQTKTQYPIRWAYLEYIQVTSTHGIAYAFMRMQMDTINKYGDLNFKMNELEKWVHEKIEELSDKSEELENSISEIKELAESLVKAKDSINSFKDEIKKQYVELDKKTDDHTAEILKLISSNVINIKRMNAFESHVKVTTDLAIRSIALQTEKVGKGLSKKIAIPVSVISILAAVIQYLVQAWAQNKLVWPF